jgi:acyl carrier protein
MNLPVPSQQEVAEVLEDLARREAGVTVPFDPELRLVEDLGLDSIRLLTLAVAVEDRFQICLDATDEAEIVTLGDLMAVVERKRRTGSDG